MADAPSPKPQSDSLAICPPQAMITVPESAVNVILSCVFACAFVKLSSVTYTAFVMVPL